MNPPTREHADFFRPFAKGAYTPSIRNAYTAKRHYGGEAVSFVPKHDEDLPVVVSFHSKDKGGAGIGRKECAHNRCLRRAHALSKTLVQQHGSGNMVFTGLGHGGYIAQTMGGLHKVGHIRYYQKGGGPGGADYGGNFWHWVKHAAKSVYNVGKKIVKKVAPAFKVVSKVWSTVSKPFKSVLENTPIIGQIMKGAEAIGLDPTDLAGSLDKVVKTGKNIAGKIEAVAKHVGINLSTKKVHEAAKQLQKAHNKVLKQVDDHHEATQHSDIVHHIVRHLDL